jgi:hypothetical protein
MALLPQAVFVWKVAAPPLEVPPRAMLGCLEAALRVAAVGV